MRYSSPRVSAFGIQFFPFVTVPILTASELSL